MTPDESPADKQIRLLHPLLDYCDVRMLEIRCGSAVEAEAVGSAVVANLGGRLRYEVIPHRSTLILLFVPPDQR